MSHAMDDCAFVPVSIHDALAKRGTSGWVDWEGIPPSASRMAEIRDDIAVVDLFQLNTWKT
jgi:hypothetical protein